MGRRLLDQGTESRLAELMTCRRHGMLSVDGDQIDTKPTPEIQGRKKRDFTEKLDQDSTNVINRQQVPTHDRD